MKYLLGNSNKGFSIIEGIVAAGIVAISILAIGMIVGRHGDFSKKSLAKQELPGVGTDVVNRVRGVMLDVKNSTTNLRTAGICQLLKPEVVLPGVSPINLDLSVELAAQAKWDAAFAPEWKMLGYKRAGGTVAEFKLSPVADKNNLVDINGIDKNSIVVDVKVTARQIDPYKSSADLFSVVTANLVDSKKAVFFIESKATYEILGTNGEKQKREVSSQDVLSVLDIGNCDVVGANGKVYAMSPSGTGSGDPSGTTIYNDTSYIKPEASIFEFMMLKREVTQGKLKPNSNLLQDIEKNVVASCSETQYRCRKNTGTRTFRDFINVRSSVIYHSVNSVTPVRKESVRVRPELQLLDASGNDQVKSRNLAVSYSSGAGGAIFTERPDNLFYALPPNGNQNDLSSPLTIGGAGTSIMATVQNAEPLCRDVCSVADPKKFIPALKLSTPDLRPAGSELGWDNQVGKADMPLHCTMCFTKACARMGLETFGPIEEFPAEPLDAQVPECASEDLAESTKILPFTGTNVAGLDNSAKCVSARISGGQLLYTARNCSESLPVMCFAYGEYVLARNIQNPNSPISVPFSAAQDACRALGGERQNKSILAEGFNQQGRSPASLSQIPGSSSEYIFENIAKSGSFLAPQSADERTQAVRRVQSMDYSRNTSEFWVALRTADGFVLADIPKASNASDRNHAIYYNGAGQITHDVVSYPLSSIFKQSASEADLGYMLVNHVKFRGVVPTSKTQPSIARYLCRHAVSGGYFLSKVGSSDFGNGGQICESEGGLFVAPTAPTAWVRAILTVQANLPFAPFPNISQDPEKVWVALEGSSMAPALQGKLGKLATRDVASTGTVDESVVHSNGHFVVARGNTLMEREIPGSTPRQTEWVPDPSVVFKVPCLSPREGEITLRNLTQGCETDERRLYKDDLKKHVISLLWVQANERNALRLNNKEFIKVGL